MSSRRSSWIGGLIFFLLGSAIAIPGAAIAISTYSWERNTQRVEGTIIRMVSTTHRKTKGRVSHGSKPIVKYTVADKTYEHESRISSSPPAYSVGQKVEVLYEPGAPHVAAINSFTERWMLPILFGGVGSLFAFIGFGMMVAQILRV